MKTTIVQQKTIGIINSLSLILFGILITSLIFALSIRLLAEYGIWLGILITGTISIAGIKKTKKPSYLRIICFAMLATLIICSTFFFVGLGILSKSLEGF